MTYKKKLIEVALPLEAINKEAAREKSIRHGHPSTLHLWWARRPLAACRAVLFSSLVDDPSEYVVELMKDSAKRKAAEKELKARKKLWDEMTAVLEKARAGGISAPPPGPEPKLEDIIAEIERERLFAIIRDLVRWENSNNENVLNAASAEIMRSCNGNPPPVYDPFCGGGSIPLEAQRLGLEAHSSDLNPVPVLINKALIEIPPKFAGKPPVNPEAKTKLSASGSWKGAAGLAEDIRYYGQWMRDEAERRIGHLYPKVKLPKECGGGEATVIAWLWARTITCPNPSCGCQMPLITTFVLSSKKGKEKFLIPCVSRNPARVRFSISSSWTGVVDPDKGAKRGTSGVFECLVCRTVTQRDYVATQAVTGKVGRMLTSVVIEFQGGRDYLPAEDIPLPPDPRSQEEDQAFIEFAANPRDLWCRNFGLTRVNHVFTARQLTTLLTFSELLHEIQIELKSASAQAGLHDYSGALSTYLALAISKLADAQSSLVRWKASMDQAIATFGRHALPMVWDFAESNPFAMAAGDFATTLRTMLRVISSLGSGSSAHVFQRDATTSFRVDRKFLISTDPPYYDNVAYADLSDFFYFWLRKNLAATYPQLFSTINVPKENELVAAAYRQGGTEKAEGFFRTGMTRALRELRTCADPTFPSTIYYAFKQTENRASGAASTGWETFLESVLDAGFGISGTWPMRSELSNRMIASGTNALASCVVLVCRPRSASSSTASRRDFLVALKRELPEALRNLQKGNIAPVDLAQAAIGPGMAVFSRYARVLETDGSPMGVRAALSLINQSLDEVLAEQEGEFDADTRWAVAWFDQNGFNEGAYGVAETLCTAKNTSVQGMKDAGILEAKGGKVRLLKKEELDPNWNPDTDPRLTIWEITHHLIRRLEQGESGAAELIHQLGAKAEVARDLSYRLYTICERRKWAQEAIAYNALVLSWGDVQRLAEERKATAVPTQGEMSL
jgi:putative DNA methylase